MTGWAAGAPKTRAQFIRNLKKSGLNAVAIAVKEYDGVTFVPDVPLAREIGAYVRAIADLAACVREFKQAGIYTIARVAVFKDDRLARRRPELAVHRPDGAIWENNNGVAWVDPYRSEVWEYNIALAVRAAQAGFDEIQFDYIRFPSDGDTSLCRYSRAGRTRETDARVISDFLSAARRRLGGVKISVCLFGLTTTVDNGMGIGQHLSALTGLADYVAPMMYPSHYRRGEMGIRDPNRDPYKTIHRGLRDAIAQLGPKAAQLRPYLQDFSLGVRYGPAQVRAQITAAENLGVTSWMLWNAQNNYTWSALQFNSSSIMRQGQK